MLFALKKPLNSFSLRVSLWEGFAESRMMGLFFSFKASGHSVPVPSGFVKAFRSLHTLTPNGNAGLIPTSNRFCTRCKPACKAKPQPKLRPYKHANVRWFKQRRIACVDLNIYLPACRCVLWVSLWLILVDPCSSYAPALDLLQRGFLLWLPFPPLFILHPLHRKNGPKPCFSEKKVGSPVHLPLRFQIEPKAKPIHHCPVASTKTIL